MITVIWILLILMAVAFSIYLTKDFIAHHNQLENSNWIKVGLIGFVVNFFDVLGIGAFAPQTALLKFTRQTRDKLIPGTMNVANTIPVLLQAIIFIRVIKVEPITLITMLITAALGAIGGAGIISKFSEKNIADAIERLILDPGLRHKFGHHAKEFMQSKFNTQIMINNYSDLYKRVIQK